MRTRFTLAAAVVCGGMWLASLPAQASPVNAADPVGLFNVGLLDGTDLSNTTGIQLDSGVTTARGAGDFRPIGGGTAVTVNGPLYLYSALGGLAGAAFSFSIGDYGTFTETAAPRILSNSLTATSTGIEAYLLGVFSPAGALDVFTAGPASFDVSFTRSSAAPARPDALEIASTSGSGTLASPPAPLPMAVDEPASLILLAAGPAMLCVVRRPGAARVRA